MTSTTNPGGGKPNTDPNMPAAADADRANAAADPQRRPAPLQHFHIVGITEKTVVVNAGTQEAREVAGGSCWHCGTTIRICVQAKDPATGEIVDIGTTCAERIGLDPTQLKEHLAERYAEQRRLRSKAYRDQQAAAYAAREAELEQRVGPHGTTARYHHEAAHGWVCDLCRAAAPHGTTTRFWDGPCTCAACLDATLASNRDFYIGPRPVLIDLATGQPADATLVDGRYGTSWLIRQPDGRPGRCVPAFRKQRATIAKHGFTYAHADFLIERTHSIRHPDIRRRRLTTPTVDDFGEPISGPSTPASPEP